MNHLQSIIKTSGKVLHDNAPAILTGVGVSGTITTAYLAVKAGMAHQRRLNEPTNTPQPTKLSPKEEFLVVWDLYIPTVISGTLTVGCIIVASRVSSKRAAAAYSILAVSERAFEEYREKVIEVIGENKEKKIKDEIVQDRINANPPSVIIGGRDGVLCCELYTGRYFNSDMETLRKAMNDVNAKLVRQEYVTLSELYDLIKLPNTSNSWNLGWRANRFLDFEFTTALGPDDKPCLAFEYNYVMPL